MEKLKRSRLFNRLNSMSIRMTFVLYALFSLLIGIIICILLISMVVLDGDDYFEFQCDDEVMHRRGGTYKFCALDIATFRRETCR